MKSFFISCLSSVQIVVLLILLTGFTTDTHATTFTVTSAADDTSPGTLRSVITLANADASGPHVINFNISGSGVHTITLTSGLPIITREMTINGYSQPGASAGTLENRTILIRIVTPAGIPNGIEVNASNVVFCGLNIITGTSSSAASAGIYHAPNLSIANNVWIWGCNFGSNAEGTARYSGQGGYSIAAYGNTSGPGAASTVNGWIIGTNGDGTNDDREGNIFAQQDIPITGVNNADIVRIFNADNFMIAGNYFGLGRDGLTPLRTFNSADGQGYAIAMSNCTGFRIGSDGNGVSDALERNVFAGINGQAIGVLGNPPSGTYNNNGAAYTNRPVGNNLISGNYFGTDKTGTGTDPALRNRIAISLRGATYNTVGSLTNAAMRNVIVNSFTTGIRISGQQFGASSPSQFNHIYGNYIGVLADGATASANAFGIHVNTNNNVLAGEISVNKNTIAGNIIAHNTGGGITVNPSSNTSQLGLVYDNTFSQNSIYANGGLGINLGSATNDFAVTPNDGALSAPTSTNGNRLMDYGVIKTASLDGNNLHINGFLGISPSGTTAFGANAVVEFFIADDSPADQNGNKFTGDGLSVPHGEGKTYLGTLTADANGLFSGILDVTGKGFVAGTSYITNTATEMAATGSTSEFGVNVTPLAISGTVANDSNGLNDNLIGGSGTNAGGTLYAALYDHTTGEVIDVVQVNADGTYSFTGAVSGSDYSIYVTNTTPALGQTIPIVTLPSGWVNTGEVNCGTPGCTGSDGTPDGVLALGILSANTIAADFGIQRPPVADPKSYTLPNAAFNTIPPAGYPALTDYQAISGASSSLAVSNGPLSGSDAEDCATAGSCNTGTGTIFNIESISANTKLYYDFGAGPVEINTAGGQVSIPNFDATKLVIYAANGSGTSANPIGFTYSMTDQAGTTSTSVPFSIETEAPMPVTLIGFNVYQENKIARLLWATASEENSKGFEIERSANAIVWTKIGFVPSGNGNSSIELKYDFTDHEPLKGVNYYRLKMVDLDQTFAFSQIRSLRIDNAGRLMVTYPNPVVNGTLKIDVSGNDSYQAVVTSAGGIRVLQQNLGKSRELNVSALAAGVYVLQVKSTSGESLTSLFVIR